MQFIQYLIFASMLGILASTANAQEFVSSHGKWSVFTIHKNGQKLCYSVSAPIKKSGNYTRRDDPYAMITRRDKTIDEVSVSSGYGYKPGSDVTLTIDKKAYLFFTKDELAWVKNVAEDKTIVAAMKKGSKMRVKGTSKKGTYSNDTYSLKGATAAYKKMVSLCR